ncbi:hypothetical protein QOZ88_07490 [Blastococcus sp. BMG 814]|uniref:Multidrug transporter n=1 Tax=Blastococcus carthaginiensis TaxID=3050034 RepID=A0ABT9IA83_9ACTN|nr:hypothetical protein [Blastococcus carthaginiensis]MDP5182479.1 hypothetical protein [Blastococcus carthaginiensis]
MVLVGNTRRLLVALGALAVVINLVSLVLRLIATDPAIAAELESGARQPVFFGFQGLLRIFSVDEEANLASWFNAALLLLSALVIWGIAVGRRAAGDRWSRHWGLLALAFAYLSADEAGRLHESADAIVDSLIEARGILSFGWILLAAPLVLAFALAYLGFLRALPAGVRKLVVIAAVLYVGGAIGVEALGGLAYDLNGGEKGSLAFVIASSIEEALEMSGALVFLAAMLVASRQLVRPAARPVELVDQRPGASPS